MKLADVERAMDRSKIWLRETFATADVFERDDLTYSGMYKAPAGLHAAGLFPEGLRGLRWLENKCLRESGEIGDAPGQPQEKPPPSYLYAYPYRVSWVIIGAQRLGAHHVARRAGDFVLSLQDEKLGGFRGLPNLPNTNPPRFHICGTAQIVPGLLALGQWKAAERAAEFLARCIERRQNENDRLPYAWDWKGEPVTDWPPPDSNFAHLDIGKAGQVTYVAALGAAALLLVYQVTGNKRFLDSAIRYQSFTRRVNEDSFTSPASGKLAWASAMLYRITGQQQYLDDCLRAAETLCKVVTSDQPMFLSQRFKDFKDQPLMITWEVGFEYPYWLQEILKALK